jgi:hypothetical protein
MAKRVSKSGPAFQAPSGTGQLENIAKGEDLVTSCDAGKPLWRHPEMPAVVSSAIRLAASNCGPDGERIHSPRPWR